MQYTKDISSDLTDIDALRLEFNHAKVTLEKLARRDMEFDVKHHKMSSQRVWLKDCIKEWRDKVGRLDVIVTDFKNAEKVRKRTEKHNAKWVEIKRNAGMGGS